jgi:hypothetical protein
MDPGVNGQQKWPGLQESIEQIPLTRQTIGAGAFATAKCRLLPIKRSSQASVGPKDHLIVRWAAGHASRVKLLGPLRCSPHFAGRHHIIEESREFPRA